MPQLIFQQLQYFDLQSFDNMTTDAKWNDSYRKLVQFQARNGYVPNPGNDTGLRRWCETQRNNYQHNRLSNERIRQLQNVEGWWWRREGGVNWPRFFMIVSILFTIYVYFFY